MYKEILPFNGAQYSSSITLHWVTIQEVTIIIPKNYIPPVLGLRFGFTVKYSALPLGVPSGFALGN